MSHEREPLRILFIGNSLTYMGNLPAVLDALAASQGRVVHSDMIAEGGVTLTWHLSDGSMQRAFSTTHYDYVVFQERGGDLICAFGPDSCRDAEASLGVLARMADGYGAKAVMLGTYQSLAGASDALLRAESDTARRLSIAYVPVSGYFLAGLSSSPDAQWLHQDGAHPGHDLTLLQAVLLYEHLFSELPDASDLAVRAPMDGPGSSVSSYIYSARQMAVVLAIASDSAP